jgi:hypothetical protein
MAPIGPGRFHSQISDSGSRSSARIAFPDFVRFTGASFAGSSKIEERIRWVAAPEIKKFQRHVTRGKAVSSGLRQHKETEP